MSDHTAALNLAAPYAISAINPIDSACGLASHRLGKEPVSRNSTQTIFELAE